VNTETTGVDCHPFSPHEAVPRQDASPVNISDIVSLKEHPIKQIAIVIVVGKCLFRLLPSLSNVLHCKEIPIYEFSGKELRGLSPNFHIHVSVIGLYIPTMGLPILLGLYKSLSDT
jgi:hypothetical protein